MHVSANRELRSLESQLFCSGGSEVCEVEGLFGIAMEEQIIVVLRIIGEI